MQYERESKYVSRGVPAAIEKESESETDSKEVGQTQTEKKNKKVYKSNHYASER